MTAHRHHYAVIIGIKYYPGLTDLHSALEDAKAFHRWVTTQGGVPTENAKLILIDPADFTDAIHAKPTKGEVTLALREVNNAALILRESSPLSWKETRLYFYLSGHGIALGGREAALLMANWDEDAVAETIPCDMYLKTYEDCQFFHEVVVFADCCRNRKVAEFVGPGFPKPGTMVGKVKTFLGFATQPEEAAYEPTNGMGDDARSYFTQALIEGLEGAAADPQTGEINSDTLARYLGQRVPKLTEHKKYRQIPQAFIDVITAPIVFRAPINGPVSRPKRKVTLNFPPTFGGTVDLYKDTQYCGSWRSTEGPWALELEDGLYKVKPSGATDGSGFRDNGLFEVTGDLNADL